MSSETQKMQKFEENRLDKVLSKIRIVRDNLERVLKNQDANIKEQKDELWENARDLDHAEKAMVRQDIDRTVLSAESHASHLRRLDMLVNSPYFARIDFQEQGEENREVYIGIHTFTDQKTHQSLVMDWRAPISSMFYDFETGPAYFTAPKGEVKGEIHRKRQYKIENSELKYVFETNLSIHDEVLQKELGGASDDKMRNIVSTIQRDQNAIIRNESSKVLVIQGVAGSGKSSIALHRVAYLLYRNKESLSSTDMLIISPNEVFSDYISNVLPELGEDNIPEMGIEKIAQGILGKKVKHESFLQQVARLVEKPDAAYAERIRFKSDPELISLLNRYIRHAVGTQFEPVDLEIGPYVIPAEFVAKFYNKYSSLSGDRRINQVTKDLIEFDKRIRLSIPQKEEIPKLLKKMVNIKTPLTYYKEFYSWLEKPELFKRIAKGLEYADLFPLCYLTMRMKGYESYDHVKHLLIDEMQDYTPIQYQILNMLFPCRKTILGDATQRINPYSSSTHVSIRDVFDDSDLVKLTKSYRCTWEITQFAQNISNDPDLEAVQRHGEAPGVHTVSTKALQLSKTKELLVEFGNSEYHSCAIICKSMKQVKAMHKELHEEFEELSILDESATGFGPGISITTAYLAKGLEFDQVVIPFADENHYVDEMDRGLLYVACTRAMHKLDLIGLKILSEFIS